MVTGLMTKAEKVVVDRALFLAFFPHPLFYLSNFYLVLFKKEKELNLKSS